MFMSDLLKINTNMLEPKTNMSDIKTGILKVQQVVESVLEEIHRDYLLQADARDCDFKRPCRQTFNRHVSKTEGCFFEGGGVLRGFDEDSVLDAARARNGLGHCAVSFPLLRRGILYVVPSKQAHQALERSFNQELNRIFFCHHTRRRHENILCLAFT